MQRRAHKVNHMKRIAPDSWLKRTLLLDAVISGAVALLQILAPQTVSDLTGFGHTLLVESGAFLVGYVALLVVLATRPQVPAMLIHAVIIGNVGWALGCVAAVELSSGVTTLGAMYAGIQAAAVLVFAALELVGRRSSAAHVQPALH